jgi:hypothetical protein
MIPLLIEELWKQRISSIKVMKTLLVAEKKCKASYDLLKYSGFPSKPH